MINYVAHRRFDSLFYSFASIDGCHSLQLSVFELLTRRAQDASDWPWYVSSLWSRNSFPKLQHSNNTKHSTRRKHPTDHGLGLQFREYPSRSRRVMASPKRKRKPNRTTTNKRPKYTLPDTDSGSSSSSSAEEGTAPDSQEEWEAVRILEQRGQGFALQYLIEWKDIDPATGQPWAPTWERASNAGAALRASWRAELGRRAQEKKEATAVARRSTQQRGAREESPAQATQTRGARRSRVVESPESSESTKAVDSSTVPKQRPAAIASSTTIDLEAPLPDWTSPQVNIDVRRDSFNRGEYEPFSEIPESQSSPEKSAVEGTTLESSQLFASQPAFLASGIVRDTQSSAGDVSYIPVTQEELESSLHSDSSDGFDEDHVIGYSVSQRCMSPESVFANLFEGSPRYQRSTKAWRTPAFTCDLNRRNSRRYHPGLSQPASTRQPARTVWNLWYPRVAVSSNFSQGPSQRHPPRLRH
jgi:hypothetical protein